MKPLHIFRAGRHAPMAGDPLDFSEADIAAMAAAYDPALLEAPLVVGHPATDAPAYGWVGALHARGGDLIAEPRQVEPAFAELVQAGRYKRISASFYPPQHARNPKPGAYYLKHVGFLGAAAPAVKGLKPIAFATDEDVVTLEFAAEAVSPWRLSWLLGDIGALFRGVRDWMVAEKGVEEADRILPPAAVARIADEAARMQGEADAAAKAPPAYSEPDPQEDRQVEDTAAERQAALDARERALAEREAAMAAREAEARAAETAAFVEGLVREARIPRGLVPRILAFAAALPTDGEVSFAEGETQVRQTPAAAFRALLSALPPRVEFAEVARPDAAAFAADDPTAIADAAHALIAEQARAGISLSMAEAVQHVTERRISA
jgi:hypothetical protein